MRFPHTVLGAAAIFMYVGAEVTGGSVIVNFTNPETISQGAGALRYPHTVLGAVAIFMYVGGEVTVGSVIVNFLGTPRLGSIPSKTASAYLSYHWGGRMIGRFMGSFALIGLGRVKDAFLVAVPPARRGS